MAGGHSQNSPKLYKIIEDVCFIDDIAIETKTDNFKDKNTFTCSPRLFVYQTIETKVKLIFDLHKSPIDDKTKLMPKINEWQELNFNLIYNHNQPFLNLKFNPFNSSLISFLNSAKKITVLRVPCLRYTAISSNEITGYRKNDIESINPPAAFKIPERGGENFEVDFYRWNPKKDFKHLILIVSGFILIVWNLETNKHRKLNLDIHSTRYSLEAKIIDIDWDPSGEYFLVTFENKQSIVFSQDLKACGMIWEEMRSEKALLLQPRIRKGSFNNISFYIFTCGKLFEDNKDKFKYGIVDLKVENVITLNLIHFRIFISKIFISKGKDNNSQKFNFSRNR